MSKQPYFWLELIAEESGCSEVFYPPVGPRDYRIGYHQDVNVFGDIIAAVIGHPSIQQLDYQQDENPKNMIYSYSKGGLVVRLKCCKGSIDDQGIAGLIKDTDFYQMSVVRAILGMLKPVELGYHVMHNPIKNWKWRLLDDSEQKTITESTL